MSTRSFRIDGLLLYIPANILKSAEDALKGPTELVAKSAMETSHLHCVTQIEISVNRSDK